MKNLRSETLNYKPHKNPQYSPHEYVPINWTSHTNRQYAMEEDTSAFLSIPDTKYVQSAIGSLLYYGRALDGSILPTLSKIASKQATPTIKTKQQIQHLLDYVNSYPTAYLRFHASDMELTVDSDAAYLVMPKARSRIAGHFRLLDKSTVPHRSLYNGAIHIECRTLRHVVSSAAEAETNGVFQNAKIALPICHILNEIGHPQPPTTIYTDNSTTSGFCQNNIQLKKSKSWDMNLHWLQD